MVMISDLRAILSFAVRLRGMAPIVTSSKNLTYRLKYEEKKGWPAGAYELIMVETSCHTALGDVKPSPFRKTLSRISSVRSNFGESKTRRRRCMSRSAQRSVRWFDWLYLMIEANGDHAVHAQTGSAASDRRMYAGAVLLYDTLSNRK